MKERQVLVKVELSEEEIKAMHIANQALEKVKETMIDTWRKHPNNCYLGVKSFCSCDELYDFVGGGMTRLLDFNEIYIVVDEYIDEDEEE